MPTMLLASAFFRGPSGGVSLVFTVCAPKWKAFFQLPVTLFFLVLFGVAVYVTFVLELVHTIFLRILPLTKKKLHTKRKEFRNRGRKAFQP